MSATNEATIRRQIRRGELTPDDRRFFDILSSLSFAAGVAVVLVQIFPPSRVEPAREQPMEIARLLLKPPPPPPEIKKEEPKPEPLPPRQDTEKPKPAPPKVIAKAPSPPKAPKPEPPRRSVATLGLLSMLSSEKPRNEAASQRIGEALRNVDFRQARDLSEDVGSLTGSVGARDKATVGEMVAGMPHGTGTQVALSGNVVTPISGPGGPTATSASGGGVSGRSISEIRDVVASYIAGLKYLYDRELKQRPSIHGKLTVEFVVNGPGDVTDVRVVSSGLGYQPLESAILGRIRGWKFPSKPADSTRVTFPFDFLAPAG